MTTIEINHPETLETVTAAFYRYEQALISNDIDVLDELFWRSEYTIRYGAGENLYGYAAIQHFRQARSSNGLDRRLQNTVITTFGKNMACCSTEFISKSSEKIGRQQQTWVRMTEGWRIVAAQVSTIQPAKIKAYP